eukprot:UN27815
MRLTTKWKVPPVQTEVVPKKLTEPIQKKKTALKPAAISKQLESSMNSRSPQSPLAKLISDSNDSARNRVSSLDPVEGYMVAHPTLVRSAADLKSKEVGGLPQGTPVRVVEIQGRRARINKPMNGWISVQSSDGHRILVKNTQDASDGSDKQKVDLMSKEDQFSPATSPQIFARTPETTIKTGLEGVIAQEIIEFQTNDGLKHIYYR